LPEQREDCLFCRIARKGAYVNQSDEFVAIDDINPLAPVHVLVLPKRHVDTFRDVSEFGAEEAKRMLEFVAATAA
jgi:histidine triad (HIT) family protein